MWESRVSNDLGCHHQDNVGQVKGGDDLGLRDKALEFSVLEVAYRLVLSKELFGAVLCFDNFEGVVLLFILLGGRHRLVLMEDRPHPFDEVDTRDADQKRLDKVNEAEDEPMIAEYVVEALYRVLVGDEREIGQRQERNAHENVVCDLESEDEPIITGPEKKSFRGEVAANDCPQGTLSYEHSHEHFEIVKNRVINKEQK